MAVSRTVQGTYRLDFAQSHHRSFSDAVASTVAAAVPSATLYDYVDPDAIDDLYARGSEWELAFAVEGHQITVRGDGTVLVA
jgi:hypothetical protein